MDNLPGFNSPKVKIDVEKLLAIAQAVVSRGEIIAVINDIDLTVSSGGIRGEDDPRKTTIYFKSAKALREIEHHGHKIGFISNRSGSQIARMSRDADIKNPSIIGTYGFETYLINSHKSIIDDRFLPYAADISNLLASLESFVLEYTGHNKLISPGPEAAIPYDSDDIVLERKGVCEQFPNGLAALYNLNLINPEKREDLAQAIEEKYKSEISKIMQSQHMLATALLRIWGLNKERTRASTPGRYSIKFEPLLKQSKAYGMVNLLNSIRNNLPDKQRIGMITYAGDSDQDAQAMLALKQIVKFHNEDYIAHNPIHAYNICVKPDHMEKDAYRESDLIVEGVEGYAEVLEELAKTVSLNTSPFLPINFMQFFRI